MEQNELTYSAAVTELEEIVQLMQSPDCSLDNLAKYTTRSAELLKICKEKLTATNEEVQKIIKQLDESTK
ncbi:MAG: exodeoxyribonuclease VII small subunit [Bacteroidales bacterium]|nr:exodeoxyribonuclease VII small subunit [Bacteroidales bacterium]